MRYTELGELPKGPGFVLLYSPRAVARWPLSFALPIPRVAASLFRTIVGKVILLDFWATECGGCKIEIPWFIELERAYKAKGLDVVGVSMDVVYEDLDDAKEGWNKVNPFVHAHGINYPIVMGDRQVLKSYNIDAFPTAYLIDKAGRIGYLCRPCREG